MDKNKKLFPQRLWELIHDEKYNFCLRWSPDGQRVYLNRAEFENNYLKTPNNQFHTQKAISFVRQMNMYGFRKVDDCYYENDNFKRNCHHLLKNMARRHTNRGPFPGSTEQRNQTGQLQLQNRLPQLADQSHPERLTFAAANDRRHSVGSTANQQATRPPNISLDPQIEQPMAGTTEQATLDAHLAAINPRSPLTSTLYHRLAALNFGQTSPSITQMQEQHYDQQQQAPLDVSLNTPLIGQPRRRIIDESLNQAMNCGTMMGQPEQNQHFQPQPNMGPQNASQLSPQQWLTVRQAMQQNLARSLLQLKQTQMPLSIQQSLLVAFLQQQDPSIMLDTLAGLSFGTASGAQQNPQASGMLPPELVENQTQSSVSNLQQQTLSFPTDNNFLLNLTGQNVATTSNQAQSGDADARDSRNETTNSDCTNNSDHELLHEYDYLSMTTSSSRSSANIEPLQCTQRLEETNDTVLDLAKPSDSKSSGT